MDGGPSMDEHEGDAGPIIGMSATRLQPQVFVVCDAERGLRLDRFLARRIPRMSRNSVQEAISCRVTISSGAAAKPSRQVFPGEVVTVRPREVPETLADRAAPTILF